MIVVVDQRCPNLIEDRQHLSPIFNSGPIECDVSARNTGDGVYCFLAISDASSIR